MKNMKLDPKKLYPVSEIERENRATVMVWLKQAYEEGGALHELGENHDGYLPHIEPGGKICRARLSTEELIEYVENAINLAGGAPETKKTKSKAKPAEEVEEEEVEKEEEVEEKKPPKARAKTKPAKEVEEEEAAEEDEEPVWKTAGKAKKTEAPKGDEKESSSVSGRLEERLKSLATKSDIDKLNKRIDGCVTAEDVSTIVRAELAPLASEMRHGFNALHRGQAEIKAGLVELGDVAGAAGELIQMKMDEDLEDYEPLFPEDEADSPSH